MIGFNQTTNKLKFNFDGGALTKGETNGLQFNGRTIMGKLLTRNQELCDHYMTPLTIHNMAFKYTKEIKPKCFKMGIPLKIRQRDVPPC